VYREPKKENNLRDEMSLWFSLVPGLGQIYKGHMWLGGLIFFIIGPAALLTGLVLAPATLGVSMSIPAITVMIVAVHAYRARDMRQELTLAARQYDSRPASSH
jgi:membrane protein implicated in regulation of membrane protease activity